VRGFFVRIVRTFRVADRLRPGQSLREIQEP